MIRIAVCDDNELQCAEELRAVEAYMRERRDLLQIGSFTSGRELLRTVESEGGYGIYLLSANMTFTDGVEIARSLRKTGDNGRIIFMAEDQSRAIEAFEVGAYRYLLKPLDEVLLGKALDSAVSELRAQAPDYYDVNTRNGICRTQMEDILYVTHDNRMLHLHMSDGGIVESTLLRCSVRQMVEPLLKSGSFVMAGSSLCINLMHIRQIDDGCVEMTNGTVLFPPERTYSQVKRAYFER